MSKDRNWLLQTRVCNTEIIAEQGFETFFATGTGDDRAGNSIID